jgi:hemolysin activation/secretion protein
VLGGDWLLAWRGQAQWAPTTLLAAEQIGLGGANTLRGTEERALSGDAGFLSAFEISTPEWSPGLRAVGFVDAGWLSSHSSLAVPANDSAASVGLGLRYGQGPLSLTLDFGRVAKGSKQSRTLNGNAPQTGDHKLHVGMSARF